MYSVSASAVTTTPSEESVDSLFKNFTIAIGVLVAVSTIVQLLINWLVPGA